MKKNNILLLVTNKTLITNFKKESNITFLFPLENFCIGLPTFALENIKEEGYIFLNRILDNTDIEKFKKIITKLPKNIKGIVFDDLGILNVLIKSNLKIKKILFLNHLNSNYQSINYYLDYVDSVFISSDITINETKEILKKAKKPLVVFTFGHVNIMYSRRTLISNYNNHFKENVPNTAILQEKITNIPFIIKEDLYGTAIYTKEPFNALEYRHLDNILFNFINPLFLENDIEKIIKSPTNLDDIYPYKYLSTKETIYKLKEEEK